MANFIKGEVIILSVYDTDAAAYKPIACLTSNSLNTEVGTIETQTKCDPGVTIKQAGTFSYSIDLEGNYIDTTSSTGDTAKASHDYLLELQEAKQNITWRMDTGLVDTPFYYGEAAITGLGADFPSGEEFATFSGTLDGSGAIVRVDPKITT